MKSRKIRTIFMSILLLAVVIVATTIGQKVEAATMSKKLYTLENPTWLRNQQFSKGLDHDKQGLGMVLPKNGTIEIRQVNTNFKGNVTLELLNDDRLEESATTIGSSWVTVTATADSVPFVRTTYTSDPNPPNVEYKVSDTTPVLPTFNQGDNEADFFKKWDETNASFALISNKYIQILVPKGDKSYLKKMRDFTSIDALLAYYDSVFETYNELAGLSFTPQKATDKNIANRYFAKADKNGYGLGSYGQYHTSDTSASVINFWLTKGWGGLHEIGHGYQGTFMQDETFTTGEVWNNIYANTMQKKANGADYYNGWLYSGNIAAVEETFNKQVYVNKTPANDWNVHDKLYLLTLIKDKAGDKAFQHFNQSHRTAVNAKTLEEKPRFLDLLNKYFGESSHYNFAAYLELVQGSMSLNGKTEALYSGNKAVFPLASLFSGDNLQKARKDIALDTKWGLVSNTQLEKYNVATTMNIQFAIDDFTEIKGKVLKVKDGADVVREVKITTPTVTLKNMPIGIYSLDIPTGITRSYEPSTNYLAVSDASNSTTITMNELQTSDIATQQLVFKGLSDNVFATASVDPEKGNMEFAVTKADPHYYFAGEYVAIEVVNELGQSVFKRSMNGVKTETGKYQIAIKPGYTIKVIHQEPHRFGIIGAPSKLTNTSQNQVFKVTKYGLTSDVTGVTAQDALANYKTKLATFAATINDNAIYKNEDNIILKSMLKKGIAYLPDTDSDKAIYQKKYADLLTPKNENISNLLSGEQFQFQLKGHSDREFANMRINLDTNKATITQNAGEPHWYFLDAYASIKINKANGKEIFKKDFVGRGSVPATQNNVTIAVGDFITVTHQEFDIRLFLKNEETGETYSTYKTATYLVTADGLKKVDTSEIPTPTKDPNELDGQKFQVDFKGYSDRLFATMALDLQKEQATITQHAGQVHWVFPDAYASIKIYNTRGKQTYAKDFIGQDVAPSSLDNVSISEGYYVTVTHKEPMLRLAITNPDTKEAFAVSVKATYKVTPYGLLKVDENSIPAQSVADLVGKNFAYKFLGYADVNFANLAVNLDTMELTFSQNSGQAHIYVDKTKPYATVEVRDDDGRVVYKYDVFGSENVTAFKKNIKLEAGYYLIITHLEANVNRLKLSVGNADQGTLPSQNVYEIVDNGLAKKTLSDIPKTN
ncbi:putative mucin/carbohydrate-binding domain-containing protein [Paenilisteria newyorkensis]|uniref:putative mucin/carbohydrate-binding domain-containing protein n=1 Tax=Listeria newyorkensis TaxID=1497681 RepID=UPI000669CE26|nr:putative mucin/carbohydrate-binding domain-containing protein [Listeria newyorkensis]KMT62436.1 putative enhancing factor (viral) [Listeria newyorkensis]